MSKLSFVKYHGAGNDFILIDDRALHFNTKSVSMLCHRKFGIGADGVILLQKDKQADFRMRIFNCDGNETESCGNGLRCLMKFIATLGFSKKNCRIATHDRIVEAEFIGEKICVHMGRALNVKKLYLCGFEVHSLNTGVPHAVIFTEEKLEIVGPLLHIHSAFQPAGTNVNIARLRDDGSIFVRTSERGVGETLSCGTGAAAVGMVAARNYQLSNPIRISFLGGDMEVMIEGEEILLIGEAIRVFEGTLSC